MYYADVQKRNFTSEIEQYEFFRKENKDLLEFFQQFPEVSSNNRVDNVDQWDFPSFILHKISYFVEPQLKVFSYLLIPKNLKTSAPGILALHQHNDEYKAGKSELIGMVKNPEYTKLEAIEPNSSHITPETRTDFAYARELCERGHIVLVPDFIGFEEYRDLDWNLKNYYNEPQFIRGYEEMLSSKYLLHGSNLMIKHLHDMYIAVSILSSLEFVDSDKIGVIGYSLGGEIACLLAAFDDRIKVGVSSCGIVCYQDFLNGNWMETAELIIPGFIEKKKDFDFFIDMIPPCSFLATQGMQDLGDYGRKILERPRDNFKVEIYDGGHGFPPSIRQKAYAFIDKIFSETKNT